MQIATKANAKAKKIPAVAVSLRLSWDVDAGDAVGFAGGALDVELGAEESAIFQGGHEHLACKASSNEFEVLVLG